MKLIHLTDTHITPAGEKLFGQEAIDNLLLAIDSINREHDDAHCCVITGDLTHTGDKVSFERLRDALSKLAIPYHLVVGNHDYRPPAMDTFPEHLIPDDNGFLQRVIDLPVGKLLLLDTVKTGTDAGQYCEKRQTWLTEQLERYKDETVFLAMHHAPFKTGLKAMDFIGINATDSAAMAEIVRPYDNIKHLFFGHYHRPIAGQWQGISFSTLRSMMLQISLNLSNDKEYIGKYEQPQYGVVLIDGDTVVVHYHDYKDTGEVHCMGQVTATM